MALTDLYIGNANTIQLSDFRDAISGGLEDDVVAFCSVCESPPPSAKWKVEGASQTDPLVITSTAHGLADDDWITIVNVGDNRAAHGTFQVTVINANQFSLNDCDGTSADAWSRGGQFWRCLVDCNGLPFSHVGTGQYALTIDGDIGLIPSTTYYVILYCTGAFRDLWNTIHKVTARNRGD